MIEPCKARDEPKQRSRGGRSYSKSLAAHEGEVESEAEVQENETDLI